MSWRSTKKDKNKEKKPLFSSKVVVQAIQTAANTFRYVAKRVEKTSEAEEKSYSRIGKSSPKIITPSIESHGDSYMDYNHGTRKRNRSSSYYSTPSNTQNEPKAKSKFAWQPTRWSTFNWSSYYSIGIDDDNDNLFSKEPENYMTPTTEQIRAKVNAYSNESLITIKEAARVCYFKMIDDKDYMNPNYCRNSDDEYSSKKVLYDSIYETYIPGNTPLEQAIAVYWKVSDKLARDRRNKGSERRKNHTVEFKREDYADATVNNQLDDNYLSNKHRLEILNRISILGDLGNQFRVEKEVGEFEVFYSDTTSVRLMKSYEEIDRVDLYQRVFPNFDLKFYSKDLLVHVPVTNTERKQKIIILVDFSGSMSEDFKQIWVNAILVDRFRYVIKGEAEVFFSFFVSDPSDLFFHHVKNNEDVNEFWKNFSNDPNGNCTNIGRIVEHVSNEINKGRLHNLEIDLSRERPEILIVNDGQDSVGYDQFNYKVNAISIDEFSDELKRLCLATDGKQVQITEENTVYSYAMEDGELKKDLVYESA